MNTTRYTNVILTVLAVLLTAQLYTTWTTGPAIEPAAHAVGIPDEGAQRNQIIDQLKLLNKKTEEMATLLKSGGVKVTVANAPQQN